MGNEDKGSGVPRRSDFAFPLQREAVIPQIRLNAERSVSEEKPELMWPCEKTVRGGAATRAQGGLFCFSLAL